MKFIVLTRHPDEELILVNPAYIIIMEPYIISSDKDSATVGARLWLLDIEAAVVVAEDVEDIQASIREVQ